MSYRDDLDAAHERIKALERELESTRAELAQSTALVKAEHSALVASDENPKVSRLLGAPTRLAHEREVEGVAPESSYIEIVDYLGREFDVGGRTSTLAGRLEWTTSVQSNGIGPFISVTVTSLEGRTTIRIHERLGQLAGAIFGGVGGGVGLGGIMAPGALFMVNPILGAVALPVWLGGSWLGCRWMYRHSVKKRDRKLAEALDEITRIVTRAIERARTSEAET